MRKIFYPLLVCMMVYSYPSLAFTDQLHIGDGIPEQVGNFSTLVGFNAMANSKDCNAYDSVGLGAFVLSNTCGPENTAIGDHALAGNTDGSNNTFIGSSAYTIAQHGYANTGVGVSVMQDSQGGNYNVAFGNSTLNTVTMDTFYNSAFGGESGILLKKGSFNTLIGAKAEVGINAQNRTAIGANSVATRDNQMSFGDDYVRENLFHGDVYIPGNIYIHGALLHPATVYSYWLSFFLGYGPIFCWLIIGFFRKK